MKKCLLLAAVLLLAGSMAVGEIEFLRGPLSEAVARAKAEEKPVMIDFITDWCRWCDTLDLHTYSDASVADFINGNVVPIKIDAEKGEGVGIAKKYGVRAYPTILFIRADGEEIDRLVGYVPPEPFLASAKDYVKGVNTIRQLKEDAEKNPADPGARYALASKYASRNDMPSAVEQYRTLLELDAKNALGHNDEAEYAIAVNAVRTEKSTVKLASFVEKYPQSPLTRNAFMTLVNGAISTGDAQGAKTYFAQYDARWPDDVAMMNGYAWNCADKKINLEHAAEVSKRAVALAATDNEKAMYIDTQATVEFQRGNTDQAIALEQSALALLKNATPKERKEYEETLARFTAGKK